MADSSRTEDAFTADDWCDRGRELFQAGNYAQACDAFDRAVSRDPRRGDAYFGRGVCRYKLRRYRLARSDFDAATLMGCETGQLWSKFDRMSPEEEENGEGA
jgi:Flp pilus assembly protein TadD